MSMEVWVALPAGESVAAAAVAEEARRLGFDFAFASDVSFDNLGGFQPGNLAGFSAGAEIYLDDPADVSDLAEIFGERAATLDRIVVFRWGASYIEGAFCYVASAALVARNNGICFDTEEGLILPIERVVEVANGMLAEARKAEAS